MKRRTPLALLPWLAAALVACAPALVGSRSAPVDLARDRSVVTSAGSAVYARTSYPSGAFGFAAGAFADRMAVPVGVDGSGIRVTSAFELVDIVAPEGWTWRVDDVWSVARAGRPPSFDVTLRLDVPANARMGGQQLRGTLLARTTGAREPLALVVQVVDRR